MATNLNERYSNFWKDALTYDCPLRQRLQKKLQPMTRWLLYFCLLVSSGGSRTCIFKFKQCPKGQKHSWQIYFFSFPNFNLFDLFIDSFYIIFFISSRGKFKKSHLWYRGRLSRPVVTVTCSNASDLSTSEPKTRDEWGNKNGVTKLSLLHCLNIVVIYV